MTLLQMIDVVMAVTLALAIGHTIGFRRGKEKAERAEIGRLRDAAIEACMSRHPAGGSRSPLRVVKS